jgi:hypothetical protein
MVWWWWVVVKKAWRVGEILIFAGNNYSVGEDMQMQVSKDYSQIW